MQIKQFASKYKLTNDTVRYYEKEGLIEPIRLENGYRYYDEYCEKKIKYILVLKKLGFSLQEIKILLKLEESPPSKDCNEKSVSMFEDKIFSLEREIAFLSTAIESLKIAYKIMGEGKYVENKGKIEFLVEEAYRKMEGIEENVSS